MGRDLRCSPEVIDIIAYLAATRVPHRVTSTWRPGAVTAAGNASRHSRKLAVDFAGPSPSRDSDALADIFHAFVPVERSLNELIYAGPQVTYNIKRGQRVGKYAQGIHHDHVHVAVDPGVLLMDVPMDVDDDRPTEPPPADDDGREDMADPVDALAAPEGGVWVLTRDGGIRAYDGAPFHGSYPGILNTLTNPHPNDLNRTFVEITVRDDGRPGYMIRSSAGELYRFP